MYLERIVIIGSYNQNNGWSNHYLRTGSRNVRKTDVGRLLALNSASFRMPLLAQPERTVDDVSK